MADVRIKDALEQDEYVWIVAVEKDNTTVIIEVIPQNIG